MAPTAALDCCVMISVEAAAAEEIWTNDLRLKSSDFLLNARFGIVCSKEYTLQRFFSLNISEEIKINTRREMTLLTRFIIISER